MGCSTIKDCWECTGRGCFAGIMLDESLECVSVQSEFSGPRLFEYVNGCDDRATILPTSWKVLAIIGWIISGIFLLIIALGCICFRFGRRQWQQFPGPNATPVVPVVPVPVGAPALPPRRGSLPEVPEVDFSAFVDQEAKVLNPVQQRLLQLSTMEVCETEYFLYHRFSTRGLLFNNDPQPGFSGGAPAQTRPVVAVDMPVESEDEFPEEPTQLVSLLQRIGNRIPYIRSSPIQTRSRTRAQLLQ